MTTKIYQEKYSQLHGGRTLIEENRIKKARQIHAIISDYYREYVRNINTKDLNVLDIGCSAGMVDYYLSDKYQTIYGIDIDGNAIKIANDNYKKENIEYHLANIYELDMNKKFDIIICNSVLEHVPDQKGLLSKIYNLLSERGLCFLSVPNKYTIKKEPHYDIYMLSWLPKTLANLLLKILNKGESYYETPPSYYKLRKLCSSFNIIDYTVERIKNPSKYHLSYILRDDSILSKLPKQLLKIAAFISPSFVFILRKSNDRKSSFILR
jgi:2-polyprenyl-3-methyl-5-hydroxy-6-metoxy-1,4-benzoquinol methylase